MIGACIVTYNPDLRRLKENIEAVYDQVDKIVVVDNASENLDSLKALVSSYNTIQIIPNQDNYGIAAALNRGMKTFYKSGFSWVLSLDQDSVCPKDLIREYLKFINIEKIGIISPAIIDRNAAERDKQKIKNNQSFVETKWCITSGAFTNLEALRLSGWFDEALFIDLVDYDVCIRMRKNGYKIIQLQTIALLHQVGNMIPKKILLKDISVWNHSPIRKYYFFRNTIYVALKLRTPDVVLQCLKWWLEMFFKIVLFERCKYKKICMAFKGTKDALTKKMGKIYPKMD